MIDPQMRWLWDDIMPRANYDIVKKALNLPVDELYAEISRAIEND